MAYSLDLCDAPITCHAWNKDMSMLAICPNTCDLLIYNIKDRKAFDLAYTLNEHTQVISSVDWHPETNKIVTCSHDRNAYVWTLIEDKKIWKKDLVVLKLNRAATYVRWSPDGKKFIVGTGTNKIRFCEYQEEHHWWQSFNIKYQKPTPQPTTLCCEFFPCGDYIVSTSTTRHCSILATRDELAKPTKTGPDFIIDKFDSQGWNNSCAVSPQGNWVAFTSQDSFIRFIHRSEISFSGKTEEEKPKKTININGLPLLSIQFLGENTLVGAGYDCQPRLFYLNGEQWEDLGLIDLPDIREASGPSNKGGMAGKLAAFGGKPAPTTTENQPIHNNILLGLRIQKNTFSICANDGKVSIWPYEVIQKHFADKKLF